MATLAPVVPAIVLTSGNVKARFPQIPPKGDPNWELRRQAAEANAASWEKMEWFSPAWLRMGEVAKILADAKDRSRERANELFLYHTSTLYTLPFQAMCIAQISPQARSLKEFSSLAREAFLAFYSGYRACSISALIPAIEGSLTRIVSGSGSDDLPIAARIDRCKVSVSGKRNFVGRDKRLKTTPNDRERHRREQIHPNYSANSALIVIRPAILTP